MNIPNYSSEFPPIPPPPPIPPQPISGQKGGVKSFTETLLSTTSAATTRNEEATLLFQNIACILDDASNEEHLPHHLIKVFREFIADLSMVAHRHFDRHVKGSPRPPPPYFCVFKQSTSNATEKNALKARSVAILPERPSTSYSTALTSTAPTRQKYQQNQHQKQQIHTKSAPTNKQTHSPTEKIATKNTVADNRLLVRVSQGHPALVMSPYAVMLSLNQFLGEKIVREIQVTKTGFAICPISLAAHEKLVSRMADLESFLSTKGPCKVETPTNHNSYLISGIPRSYAGYNGTTIEMVEITASAIEEALWDLTNVRPVSVTECKSSIDQPFLDKTKWIVLYPEGSSLSKNFPLFGVRVNTKMLPKKTRTPQCGNCFGWHNERACIRAPRCRICGSTKHTENGHTICDPSRPHECPPKCANCHGPHPADSLQCLIRPTKDNKLPSKNELAQIRKISSAARLRLKTAHCGQISAKLSSAVDKDVEQAPSTPLAVRKLFTESPCTSRGRYAALSTPNLSRTNSPSAMRL